jgi:uncharacterized protein with GYD domain
MARYLTQFSYTHEGLKGLTRDGGSKRRAAVEQATKAAGGKLEAFYFAFGESDGIAIVEGVQENMLAFLLAVGASGAVRLKTTVLLDPEEIDRACKKLPSYRPPGS